MYLTEPPSRSNWTQIICVLYVLHLFIAALWSPAGKGLTSWLSFVKFNCVFVTFPCGILGQFLILIPFFLWVQFLLERICTRISYKINQKWLAWTYCLPLGLPMCINYGKYLNAESIIRAFVQVTGENYFFPVQITAHI